MPDNEQREGESAYSQNSENEEKALNLTCQLAMTVRAGRDQYTVVPEPDAGGTKTASFTA